MNDTIEIHIPTVDRCIKELKLIQYYCAGGETTNQYRVLQRGVERLEKLKRLFVS